LVLRSVHTVTKLSVSLCVFFVAPLHSRTEQRKLHSSADFEQCVTGDFAYRLHYRGLLGTRGWLYMRDSDLFRYELRMRQWLSQSHRPLVHRKTPLCSGIVAVHPWVQPAASHSALYAALFSRRLKTELSVARTTMMRLSHRAPINLKPSNSTI
jgi:hypothetical protein